MRGPDEAPKLTPAQREAIHKQLQEMRRRLGPYTRAHNSQPYAQNDSQIACILAELIELLDTKL